MNGSSLSTLRSFSAINGVSDRGIVRQGSGRDNARYGVGETIVGLKERPSAILDVTRHGKCDGPRRYRRSF
jgi:hypothetical protein